MMNTFKKAVTAAMILTAALACLLVGSLWITQEYVKFDIEAGTLRTDFINDQKLLAREEVERVLQYISYKRNLTRKELQFRLQEKVDGAILLATQIYDEYQGELSDEEIQKRIRDALRNQQFQSGRGYYFVFDMEANNILLPPFAQFEGRNFFQIEQGEGNYLVRKAIDIINESGEGFLSYYWYKPDNKLQMKEKFSYVKRLPVYGWWVGVGEYLEDFEKVVQQETLNWINQIRYGKDGYIFVYDYRGTTLAHYKPANLGVNQWDFRDSNGIPVVQELIRMVKGNQQGGYLEYVGTIRPTTGLPAPKISYARGVKDWQWMIGTGMYVDSINATITEKRKLLDEKIIKNVLIILIALSVCLLPIIILSRYFAGLISRNIEYFSEFIEYSATDARKMDIDQVRFQEFKRLARSANDMVDRRHKAEEALEMAQEQLLRSRKMEALGVLAGGVAHDLNNVLSAIIGYPDLLLKNIPADSPQRKFVEKIKDSGQKAADIVEDLLTLARRGVAQQGVVNLNQLIDEFTQSPEYERIISEFKNISVITKLDSDLMQISGSKVHLQKTVMNLVLNAAEAQPDGGKIFITTENRYIDYPLIGYQQIEEGEYAVLGVSDQGVGISKEDLEQIFEPFFTKKKMGRSGTGLGMAVVWGTVQDHNGFIDVFSSEGDGTRIELFFHVTREKSTIEEKITDLKAYAGHGEKILVVDDILEQRDLMKAMLEPLGYAVAVAASGEEAIAFLQNQAVDLVILDMILEDPEMDGYTTYKRILELHPNQKAIISSGYSETERVKKAMLLGVNSYVKKPYTIEKIGIAIREALDT